MGKLGRDTRIWDSLPRTELAQEGRNCFSTASNVAAPCVRDRVSAAQTLRAGRVRGGCWCSREKTAGQAGWATRGGAYRQSTPRVCLVIKSYIKEKKV